MVPKKIKLNIKDSVLIKECVKFYYENNTEKGSGYLLKEISAIGALIEGKDYGLPISFAIFNKKTQMTAVYEAIGFRIEDINPELYESRYWYH